MRDLEWSQRQRTCFEALIALGVLAFKPESMEFVSLPRFVGQRLAPGTPAGEITAHVDQRDAVDRAGWQAQLASGALCIDDGVQRLRPPDDAIDGAGWQAQRAADAAGLVDHREMAWPLDSARCIQRQDRFPGDRRQARNALDASGRAPVDAGACVGDRLRIAAAIGVAATGALRLRQRAVQRFEQAASGVGRPRRCGIRVPNGLRNAVTNRVRSAEPRPISCSVGTSLTCRRR